MKKIAIIGCGASGMIAALSAVKDGNEITVFEKQSRPGRKLLSTGNGRCNISNRNMEFPHYHGNNPKFVLNVFSGFGLDETLSFFESIGLPLIEEDEGRLFPESGQASSVVDILNYELKFRGIKLRHNRMIEKVVKSGSKFKLISSGKEEFYSDSLILAAGSCAYPQLGAVNTGYDIAASFGHNIYEPFPAIVPLSIPLKAVHALQGIKWDCRVTAAVNGKQISESTGELLFTKYGMSGPAALNISRDVNENILNGKDPVISIDFFPFINEKSLSEKFNNLWIRKDKSLSFSLAGILKKRIPELILKISGIDPEISVKNLNDPLRSKIVKAFKEFSLMPGKPRTFKESVVAAGGVNVDEINPGTMESKLVKNLFITGELLDIDGDSGGYNLQFAWSTGAIAGKAQL
ncbi:MAG: NAD(P)/FAD-dependent oxidoreductase [Spirochaetes bacterium]|nr:NAD(P)/FAD-dependent oxidoreductase [Spirochaetota bacterium]